MNVGVRRSSVMLSQIRAMLLVPVVLDLLLGVCLVEYLRNEAPAKDISRSWPTEFTASKTSSNPRVPVP